MPLGTEVGLGLRDIVFDVARVCLFLWGYSWAHMMLAQLPPEENAHPPLPNF